MLPLDTIYNGDCLQGMRRMGDGTVDCRSLRPALPAGEPRRRTRRKTLATEGTLGNKGQEIKEIKKAEGLASDSENEVAI